LSEKVKKLFIAVNTGYVEVTGSKVTVLIETAENQTRLIKKEPLRQKIMPNPVWVS